MKKKLLKWMIEENKKDLKLLVIAETTLIFMLIFLFLAMAFLK